MQRGWLFRARPSVLSATLVGALALCARPLLADDAPVLGPPPAPAVAPPVIPSQNAPPPIPSPAVPQSEGSGSVPPASPPPGVIPMLPVPQASPKPGTPALPDGATVLDPSLPGAPLQNPDGSPAAGPLAPIPEGGPAPNPGPPRLRMAEENEKDPKPIDEGLKPIPASMVFRTRDIVRPDLLRGKNYRLAEYAPLVDFNFRFEIETPWGTIPAQGMGMLDLRLRELCALEYGSRIAEKNPMFTEGFAQAVCGTTQGAYIFVTDPIGSVRRTGQVLKRWACVKKMPGGVKANCESRRRVACLIGCDPETRNEPLACLLDDMSINASGGFLAVEIGLDFGPPGLGFLPFNAAFKKIMEHRSTLEIQTDLDHDLIELGIPEASRTRFFAAPSYTTTERMAFVYYLKMLIGLENLASLVDGAADTRNECEALASIRELQLIVDLRHTLAIARVTFIGIPVLTLDDGTQIIATAADYLVETPRIDKMVVAYRGTFPEVTTRLATLGRVSVGAQKQFQAAGIDVIRHKLGQPDAIFAGKEKTTRSASATPGGAAPPMPAPAASSESTAGRAAPAARS